MLGEFGRKSSVLYISSNGFFLASFLQLFRFAKIFEWFCRGKSNFAAFWEPIFQIKIIFPPQNPQWQVTVLTVLSPEMSIKLKSEKNPSKIHDFIDYENIPMPVDF